MSRPLTFLTWVSILSLLTYSLNPSPRHMSQPLSSSTFHLLHMGPLPRHLHLSSSHVSTSHLITCISPHHMSRPLTFVTCISPHHIMSQPLAFFGLHVSIHLSAVIGMFDNNRPDKSRKIRDNLVENYVCRIAYSKLCEVTSSAEPSDAELGCLGSK